MLRFTVFWPCHSQYRAMRSALTWPELLQHFPSEVGARWLFFRRPFCGLGIFQSQCIVLPTWVLHDLPRSAIHVEARFFKMNLLLLSAYVVRMLATPSSCCLILCWWFCAAITRLQSSCLCANQCLALFGQIVRSLQFILPFWSISNNRSEPCLRLLGT